MNVQGNDSGQHGNIVLCQPLAPIKPESKKDLTQRTTHVATLGINGISSERKRSPSANGTKPVVVFQQLPSKEAQKQPSYLSLSPAVEDPSFSEKLSSEESVAASKLNSLGGEGIITAEDAQTLEQDLFLLPKGKTSERICVLLASWYIKKKDFDKAWGFVRDIRSESLRNQKQIEFSKQLNKKIADWKTAKDYSSLFKAVTKYYRPKKDKAKVLSANLPEMELRHFFEASKQKKEFDTAYLCIMARPQGKENDKDLIAIALEVMEEDYDLARKYATSITDDLSRQETINAIYALEEASGAEEASGESEAEELIEADYDEAMLVAQTQIERFVKQGIQDDHGASKLKKHLEGFSKDCQVAQLGYSLLAEWYLRRGSLNVAFEVIQQLRGELHGTWITKLHHSITNEINFCRSCGNYRHVLTLIITFFPSTLWAEKVRNSLSAEERRPLFESCMKGQMYAQGLLCLLARPKSEYNAKDFKHFDAEAGIFEPELVSTHQEVIKKFQSEMNGCSESEVKQAVANYGGITCDETEEACLTEQINIEELEFFVQQTWRICIDIVSKLEVSERVRLFGEMNALCQKLLTQTRNKIQRLVVSELTEAMALQPDVEPEQERKEKTASIVPNGSPQNMDQSLSAKVTTKESISIVREQLGHIQASWEKAMRFVTRLPFRSAKKSQLYMVISTIKNLSDALRVLKK